MYAKPPAAAAGEGDWEAGDAEDGDDGAEAAALAPAPKRKRASAKAKSSIEPELKAVSRHGSGPTEAPEARDGDTAAAGVAAARKPRGSRKPTTGRSAAAAALGLFAVSQQQADAADSTYAHDGVARPPGSSWAAEQQGRMGDCARRPACADAVAGADDSGDALSVVTLGNDTGGDDSDASGGESEEGLLESGDETGSPSAAGAAGSAGRGLSATYAGGHGRDVRSAARAGSDGARDAQTETNDLLAQLLGSENLILQAAAAAARASAAASGGRRRTSCSGEYAAASSAFLPLEERLRRRLLADGGSCADGGRSAGAASSSALDGVQVCLSSRGALEVAGAGAADAQPAVAGAIKRKRAQAVDATRLAAAAGVVDAAAPAAGKLGAGAVKKLRAAGAGASADATAADGADTSASRLGVPTAGAGAIDARVSAAVAPVGSLHALPACALCHKPIVAAAASAVRTFGGSLRLGADLLAQQGHPSAADGSYRAVSNGAAVADLRSVVDRPVAVGSDAVGAAAEPETETETEEECLDLCGGAGNGAELQQPLTTDAEVGRSATATGGMVRDGMKPGVAAFVDCPVCAARFHPICLADYMIQTTAAARFAGHPSGGDLSAALLQHLLPPQPCFCPGPGTTVAATASRGASVSVVVGRAGWPVGCTALLSWHEVAGRARRRMAAQGDVRTGSRAPAKAAGAGDSRMAGASVDRPEAHHGGLRLLR